MDKFFSRDSVDGQWYYSKYPDVRESGFSAEEHYLLYGKNEGRFANAMSEELFRFAADFDGDWYLKRYPDVSSGPLDPLLHYVLYGRIEGRYSSSTAELLATCARGFDADWYVSMYPDVAAADVAPLEHYVRYGRFEDRLKSAEDQQQVIRIKYEPFIREVYRLLLEREPSDAEISERVAGMTGDWSYVHTLRSIFYSPEAEILKSANKAVNKTGIQNISNRPEQYSSLPEARNLTTKARNLFGFMMDQKQMLNFGGN